MFINSLDPRGRVVSTLLFSCSLAVLQTCLATFVALCIGLLLLFLNKPTLQTLVKRFMTVNTFILFLWLVTPWSTPGTPVANLGFFQLTWEGLSLTTLVTLKANALTAFFLAEIASLEMSIFGHALERLGISQKLIFIFLFATRYLDVLSKEWQRLQNAAKLRAFQAKCNLHSYRTLAGLLGLLLIRAYDRAQRAYEAMLLRGFNGHFHSVTNFIWYRRDSLFLLFTTICIVGLLWLDLS